MYKHAKLVSDLGTFKSTFSLQDAVQAPVTGSWVEVSVRSTLKEESNSVLLLWS